jgi:hypothetical protein
MMLDPGSRPPRQLQDPRNHSYKRALTLLFLPILFLVSCALMTGYDPTSYKTATDLKAESLILMDKATAAPDDAQLAKIDELWVNLSKAYEYEAGKDGPNIETVKQWKLLKDPEKDLLGGFLKLWGKKKGGANGLSEGFITEKKEQVGKAFDEIIKLESAKVKD